MYDFRNISLKELRDIDFTGSFPSNELSWMSDWQDVFENVENNVLGFKRRPFIVAAYKEKELKAIVPLVKLCRSYFKYIRIEFLEFLGQQWSNLGNDIIAFDHLEDVFVADLISWVKKNVSYHFLFLKYLPENTLFANKYRLFHYAGAPFVQIDKHNNYESFAQKVYTRKFREDLRRTLRKIQKDKFEFEVDFEEINESSLAEIKRIAKSKTTDCKSFLYKDAGKTQFHLRVYNCFPSNVVFVKLNKQVVAYATCIDWDGVRIGIDASFDRKYRKYGVGIHCIDTIIQTSFKDKIPKLSFGLGLDNYKFQFTDRIDPFFMCFDFKYRLKSLLALPYFLYLLKKEDQSVLEKLQRVK